MTAMTNPLTIQLPPNLEQQMLQEAQKQNITLEKLRDPDPNIRIQGVQALGKLACEPA
jgi:hypothetical protein